MQFSQEENERYQRHFSLPQVGREGQAKLKRAKLLIVGAGGLGCPAALYLAAAGVGEISLVDFDQVKLSNLQRQILFSTDRLGSLKVDVAKSSLEQLNPSIKINAIPLKLTKSNAAELIEAHDFIIDGTDNFEARYLINDFCVANKKPLVFGAIYRFDGQVSVFNFEGGPCYRCLYPKAPLLEAVSNCSEAGVLGILPGIIGSLMANEALKLILGIGQIASGRVLLFDSLRSEFSKREFKSKIDCSGCGKAPHLIQEDKPPIKELFIDKMSALSEYFVLDVRGPGEYKAKHLSGAFNISLAQLRSQLTQVPNEQNILVVCKSGKRSRRAAEILLDSGFQNVYQFAGGLDRISDEKGFKYE